MEKLSVIFTKNVLIFISVFIFSLVFQSFVWTHLEPVLVDKTVWTDAITIIANGGNIGSDSLLYGYPAFTLLAIGKVIVGAGFSSSTAFTLIIVFFVSLGIASVVTLTHILEPQKMWWVACLGLLSFSPYLPDATPPSIIVSSLIPIIVLLILFLVKNEKDNSMLALIFLGLVSGFSLSTRIDITLTICSLATVLLIAKFNKKLFIPISLAFLIFCSFSFYLDNNPIGYFIGTYTKSHLAYIGYFGESSARFFSSSLFLSSFLALVTIFIGTIEYLSKNIKLLVPKGFFVWFLLSTCFIAGAIFLASFHPVWYFIPLIVSWEIFLPIFIFSIIESLYPKLEESKKMNFFATLVLFCVHLCPFIIFFMP